MTEFQDLNLDEAMLVDGGGSMSDALMFAAGGVMTAAGFVATVASTSLYFTGVGAVPATAAVFGGFSMMQYGIDTMRDAYGRTF